MLHQLYNFPRTKSFIVACSGGSDSLAVADFYFRGNKSFRLAYFHHGTPQADEMLSVVHKFAGDRNIDLFVGTLTETKPKDKSPEEFFRDERYRWLIRISYGQDIITCHHLGDAVEGYIFSSLHGNPKLIRSCGMISSYGQNATVYRPFLTNTKEQLRKWCIDHQVEWCEDKSNADTNYPRNFIRHQLLPQCLKVNPGLFKTIKKKIIEERGKEYNGY